MNIFTIKLKNGEEFIAEIVEQGEDALLVKHPVVLIANGQGGHSFTPWISTARSTEFWIDVSDIRFTCETVPELTEAYANMFGNNTNIDSSIVVPNKQIITD